MKHVRFLLLLILVLALCLPAVSMAEGQLGSAMPDFTVSTIDGGSFTLSEALKDHDMVLINLWATWCGPCAAEFPYMEEAYQQYQDKVAIIALSVEANDDDAALSAYASSHGMTFPVGSDRETNLASYFGVSSIPTSIVVDRFGAICYIAAGSMDSLAQFSRLFDVFVDDAYTETKVYTSLPPAKPTVEAPDLAEVSTALNAAGSIVFSNPTDPYIWPMQVLGYDGPEWVESTNKDQDDSTAAIYAHVDAAAGDYLAFDYQTSTEAAMDLLKIYVDGALVKCFGGIVDWTTWLLPLEEGSHDITFAYEKDDYDSDTSDYVRLDNVRLVNGEEADALLATLPVYPVGDQLALTLLDSEDAREIVFQGEHASLMELLFGRQTYWILNQSFAMASLTIGPDADPETAFAYSNYDGSSVPYAEECRIHGRVNGDTPIDAFFYVDSMDATGYPFTTITLYASVDGETASIIVFVDEENADAFVDLLEQQVGISVTWTYADSSDAQGDAQ